MCELKQTLAGTYMISLSDDMARVLIALGRDNVPPDVELSNDELIEVAVDLLAMSYDASIPNDGGLSAEPMSADELREAIDKSLNPDISIGDVAVHSPQGNLNL